VHIAAAMHFSPKFMDRSAMKRPANLIAALLLFSSGLFAQTPGDSLHSTGPSPNNPSANSLSGNVTDSATGKPLAGVSVFLNNTSHGAVTRADGSFLLKDIPKGSYQVVFSAIGYATAITDINGSRLPSALRVILHPRAVELAAVTVEPYEKNGWSRWGKFFMENFIGTGENAPSCDIRNRNVLRFHYSKRSNRLLVTAAEPLLVENNALGYILEYQLEQFAADLNSKTVTYFGYPFFQEMTTTKENRQMKWTAGRRTAYTGSMMHFMRSLYAGRSIKEGFLAERQVIIPNEEKIRVKDIYRPDFQKAGQFPMDTLHYFWEVLRQPNMITRMLIVPPDSILTTHEDGRRYLFFEGRLTVVYGVNDRSGDFRTSEMRLLNPVRITVEENGNYYPPQVLLTSGFWGQSEKISNLLPLDYEPTYPTIH
jgi:CarboxypepD_reg-like domain